MRLDIFLVQKGFISSRAKAKELIEAGSVFLNGKPVLKPAWDVNDTDQIDIKKDDICPYVSRGGLKLDFALKSFQISVQGKTCLDIGSSTGGFTDCMLQNGASHVYALDCGKDQIHPSLIFDDRITLLEGYNAKYLNPKDFPNQPTFVSIDVSFISQTLILPTLYNLLPLGSEVVSLIKPQFELTKASLSKKGVVKSEKDRLCAIERVRETIVSLGFTEKNIINSPILGGEGNVEYLIHFLKKE